MQSQRMLPAGVASRNARWLIAKAGTGCRLISPGWCAAQALRRLAASASRAIQAWPPRGRYCRSSAQIGQRARRRVGLGNEVPQAVQKKSVIAGLRPRGRKWGGGASGPRSR